MGGGGGLYIVEFHCDLECVYGIIIKPNRLLSIFTDDLRNLH